MAEQVLGGRFALLDRLGSGGMSVVWRAREEVLGRTVAVKVLAPLEARSRQAATTRAPTGDRRRRLRLYPASACSSALSAVPGPAVAEAPLTSIDRLVLLVVALQLGMSRDEVADV